MEPSRRQAVRSDQNGWGATLRGALRSTHIIESDTWYEAARRARLEARRQFLRLASLR